MTIVLLTFHVKQVKPRFTTTSRIITSKKLKNSEILEMSEKIQRDEKLSKYFKMFDKSLKLPY